MTSVVRVVSPPAIEGGSAAPLVASFFKDTAGSLLEKLVRPAGLVPAAALVLLNLAFVYPTARDAQQGWAGSFESLSSGWKVAAVTAVVLAVGLMLQGAGVAVMMVLEGAAWQDTPFGQFLTRRQRAKLDRERDALRAAAGHEQTGRAWRIERRFGVEADPKTPTEDEDVAPTALGNVLKAVKHTIAERYGIDPVPLLRHMHATAKSDTSSALSALDDERANLELYANLAAVVSFFALECLAFFGKRGSWGAALLGSSALLAAYGVYQVTVAKARSWSDAVGVLFDLHRGELHDTLKLRKTDGFDDEHALWRQASRFYRPPGEPIGADLFDEQPDPPTASVTVDGDVEATLVQATLVERRDGTLAAAAPLTCVSYRILVARTHEAGLTAASEILVADPRIAGIEAPPEPLHDAGAAAVVVDDGASVALCWRFRRLRRGDSMLLAYTLPVWVLEAEPADAGIGFVRLGEGGRFRIACDPARNATAALTARYLGAGDFTPPVLSVAGVPQRGAVPVSGGRPERAFVWEQIPFAGGLVTLELQDAGGGAE